MGRYIKGAQIKVVAATVTKNYTKKIQCLLKVVICALGLEVSHPLQASYINIPVSIKDNLRTADHGLRTEYTTRTRYKMRTTDYVY